MSRPVDKNFIAAMEAKLQQGRVDGKVGWDKHWKNTRFHRSDVSGATGMFMDYLQHEVLELAVALMDGDRDKILHECADVANYAMMIADYRGCLCDTKEKDYG